MRRSRRERLRRAPWGKWKPMEHITQEAKDKDVNVASWMRGHLEKISTRTEVSTADWPGDEWAPGSRHQGRRKRASPATSPTMVTQASAPFLWGHFSAWLQTRSGSLSAFAPGLSTASRWPSWHRTGLAAASESWTFERTGLWMLKLTDLAAAPGSRSLYNRTRTVHLNRISFRRTLLGGKRMLLDGRSIAA
jgi:hypothetical protein